MEERQFQTFSSKCFKLCYFRRLTPMTMLQQLKTLKRLNEELTKCQNLPRKNIRHISSRYFKQQQQNFNVCIEIYSFTLQVLIVFSKPSIYFIIV